MFIAETLRRLKTRGPSNYFRKLKEASTQILDGLDIIGIDYIPGLESRWGFGKPPHDRLLKLTMERSEDFRNILREIPNSVSNLVALGEHKTDAITPYWDNQYIAPFDAIVLNYFLRYFRPATYLEVGSGNSTAFARHAISSFSLPTKIISIDLHPRREVKELSDSNIEKQLQDIDVSLFSTLRPGDILFFDGSHRVLMNSDVVILFLDILPILAQGVIVHIHDIMLPMDYPPHWKKRYFSEAYMLGVYLLQKPNPNPILMPNYFVSKSGHFQKEIDSIYNLFPINFKGRGGVSYWMIKA